MGAVFKRRGGASLGMGRGFSSATILTKFSGGFSSYFHDFSTTIGPRSGHDRGSFMVLSFRRSSLNQVGTIPPRKTYDRGSIMPRSRLDRTAILGFFPVLSAPSNDKTAGWTIVINGSGMPRSRCRSVVR